MASRASIADMTGQRVRAMAYPYGRHTPDLRSVVAQTFDLAFGIEEGRNRSGTDRYQLRRTMVQCRDTVADVAFRVAAGRSPIERAKTSLHRRLFPHER
jgi:hypothetical protein